MSNKPTTRARESQNGKNGSERLDADRIAAHTRRDFQQNAEKRYQWPPQRDPNLDYKNKTRNPVQSIITALPLLMLVAGLYLYYRGESQQTGGAPISAESITLVGTYTGTSATSGRHYLWLEPDGNPRSLRVTAEQAELMDLLERGITLSVKAAPHVQGSKTFWIWYVEQSDTVLIDGSSSLRESEPASD